MYTFSTKNLLHEKSVNKVLWAWKILAEIITTQKLIFATSHLLTLTSPFYNIQWQFSINRHRLFLQLGHELRGLYDAISDSEKEYCRNDAESKWQWSSRKVLPANIKGVFYIGIVGKYFKISLLRNIRNILTPSYYVGIQNNWVILRLRGKFTPGRD